MRILGKLHRQSTVAHSRLRKQKPWISVMWVNIFLLKLFDNKQIRSIFFGVLLYSSFNSVFRDLEGHCGCLATHQISSFGQGGNVMREDEEEVSVLAVLCLTFS